MSRGQVPGPGTRFDSFFEATFVCVKFREYYIHTALGYYEGVFLIIVR